MRMVLLTNVVSPHQLPLASALAERLGHDNFRYVATEGQHSERTDLGWHFEDLPTWILYPKRSALDASKTERWCSEADVLLCGMRNVDLFRHRARAGLTSLYTSERWFKPPVGFLRMFHPRYLQMAWRLWDLQRQGALTYLPMGVHAAGDMARMSGLFHGDLRCLFRQPRLKWSASRPLASLTTSGSPSPKQSLPTGADRMRLWGYFVDPSDQADLTATQVRLSKCPTRMNDDGPIRVLWVGRMLSWKRADTLINAVVQLLSEGTPIQLRLVGQGPEEENLKQLVGPYLLETPDSQACRNTTSPHCPPFSGVMVNPAIGMNLSLGFINGEQPTNALVRFRSMPGIFFSTAVPIKQVRTLMRESDVVVLTSDGGEGWGAVVNEAMAEGCCVIGTYEAGSSATLIEHGVNGFLYRAGDVNELKACLLQCQPSTRHELGARARGVLETVWSPTAAADQLLAFLQHTA